MKIEDVKFNNFIRLCKEHGLDPNADQKGCGKKLAQFKIIQYYRFSKLDY
jgi:hypothetical protein